MTTDFNAFISHFSKSLHNLFRVETNINELSLERGLPKKVWSEILDLEPFTVAIPEEFGGRGAKVKECLSVLSAASYESLPLSLALGINIGLFLEPLAKYGDQKVKRKIFDRFLNEKVMGGLMITEPDFGSDALNMATFYEEKESEIQIKGQKHWQGLTGMADFWLVVAREKLKSGKLSRDVSFFVTENKVIKQEIKVDRYFNNPGLYMIPYGLNHIDIALPKEQQLKPKGTGIKMMLDVLHRSRMQFPGMGMGFIKRMLDEAIKQVTNRKVGGKLLVELDSVQYQLSRIQASYTICSGMCARSSEISGIDNDLSSYGLEANSIKALVSDLMNEAANICAQLSGAGGYKIENIAGRGIMDSRPFQIFEGSNEMLYTQIAEMIGKQMRKMKDINFYDFLSKTDYCNLIIDRFKKHLQFKLPTDTVQRQSITIGKIVARLVSLQYAFNITQKGYRKDLYENCLKHMEMDIKKLLTNLTDYNDAKPILEYAENSDWRSFA
ncbi:MAG TPA: acyl-CoA dehydrogenase family protein [Flavobacteriaceae bacterium]|nr:acyl-CoA dehydrogenase family protein [Flavobacteriaceae bacterium]